MKQHKTDSRRLPRKPLVTAITASLALAAGSASALEVTGSFSGWWDQPEQRNHGLILTISTLPDGSKTGVAFWAHFNESGQPSWLFAQGPIVGDTIEAELYSIDGVTFMEAKSVQKTPAVAIGTMDITFSDCKGGRVAFSTTDSDIGSGVFGISRLTRQPGVRCSGGISDDRSPEAPPEIFRILLAPLDPNSSAKGKAKFKDTLQEREFEVEIEVPEDGEYLLYVQGETENGEPATDSDGNPSMDLRGSISVRRDDEEDDFEGEIEFSSPADDDEEELLLFNPRGKLIEVHRVLGEDDGEVVLVGLMDDEGAVPSMPEGEVPDFGDQKIKIRFSNTAGGEGEAELDPDDDEVEFEIEIEDVSPGAYHVLIEGLEIVNEAGEPVPAKWPLIVPDDDDEGELEFRDPWDFGTLPLNFDPRGKTFKITDEDEGIVAFEFDFPLEATEDEDDSEDDDSDDDEDESGDEDEDSEDDSDDDEDESEDEDSEEEDEDPEDEDSDEEEEDDSEDDDSEDEEDESDDEDDDSDEEDSDDEEDGSDDDDNGSDDDDNGSDDDDNGSDDDDDSDEDDDDSEEDEEDSDDDDESDDEQDDEEDDE